jgi:CBS domain-containing protein
MSVKNLHTFHLHGDFELATLHQIPRLTLDSPATAILQDFRLHPAVTVGPDTPVDEAQWLLEQSHIPELFVVDNSGHLCGLASKSSLSEQLVLKLVSQGFSRASLAVSDFMTSRRFIAAMAYPEFTALSVGRIIDLLQRRGLTNLVVVDEDTREIIGILSSALLKKVFDLPDRMEPATSFAEILEAIMH